MTTKPPTIKELEKKFDEEFDTGSGSGSYVSPSRVKQFLRRELEDVLEGLRMERKKINLQQDLMSHVFEKMGYNKAVKKINAKIDKLKGENKNG